MISPKTKHLFHSAILMSGSALNPFLPRRHDHKSILYNLGKILSKHNYRLEFRYGLFEHQTDSLGSILAENLHYPISNDNDLLEFLQQIDGKQLTKMTYQKDYEPGFGRKSFNRIWTVCIEGNVIYLVPH